MKLLRPLGIAFVLLLLLVATAAGQSDDEQAIEPYQAGWGMRIVFATSTTITEANALRLEHDLELQPSPYTSRDGRPFNYRFDDDSQYAAFARFYYDGECSAEPGAAQPCAPIEPLYGYYSPVSVAVETQLRNDARVAQIDNANAPAFFLTWLIRGFLQTLFHRWGR